MGVGVVLGDVRDADEAFSLGVLSEASRRVEGCSLQLNGPYAYNVTSEQDWVNRRARDGYVVEVGGGELLAGLEQAGLAECGGRRGGLGRGRREAVTALALHGKRGGGCGNRHH